MSNQEEREIKQQAVLNYTVIEVYRHCGQFKSKVSQLTVNAHSLKVAQEFAENNRRHEKNAN